MSMQVLQEKRQISVARQEMENRGISFIESPLPSLLRRFGLNHSMAIGDKIKSWDVLESIKFIEKNIDKSEPVLDIGCYASEILIALHQLGYNNLAGVDLNPGLANMPEQEEINFQTANFMETKFESETFQVITSISVIEHGYDPERLIKEMSRLLKPGGYFIASFDYWPEKIDTSGVKFFDMDWLIFSQQDVEAFVKLAAEYGLSPLGEMKYAAKDKAIQCGGRRYTFGWLVLKKTG